MKFGLEAKVGIFVILGLIILGYMTTKVGSFNFGKDNGYTVKGIINNASGLAKDSTVKFKGVDVGKVKNIYLENGKVNVDLLMNEGTKIPSNVRIIVRSAGFLGEKFAELEQFGNESGEFLTAQSTIKETKDTTDFDQLGNKFGEVADDIKAITSALKDVLATTEGKENMKMTLENVRYTTETLREIMLDNHNRINLIVKNIESITSSVKNVTNANQQNVNDLIKNLKDVSVALKNQTPEIAAKVNNITKNVDSLVTDSKDDVQDTIKNVKTLTAKLDKTVENLNSITTKINKGEGSVGKLVNDNQTVDNLNDTLKGVKNLFTKIDEFKFYLNFEGEKYLDTGDSKGYFKLKIQPREDKYYLLGLASSPNGRSQTTYKDYDAVYYGTPPADIGTNTVSYSSTETIRKENSVTFIAQYAKRFLNTVDLRIGLMESEFGLGADYFPLKGKNKDKLMLSFDAYDFSTKKSDKNVHAKVKAQYNYNNNLYLNAGYDDFFNKKTKSTFVGGGIMFLDDDLKYLLGKIPLPTN